MSSDEEMAVVNPNASPIDLDDVYTNRKASLTIFMGKSKSGKTYALCWLIKRLTYELKHFKFGAVFCSTSFNGTYDFIDKRYRFGSFDEEKHKRYTQKLQEMKEQMGDNMPPNFIIYDDLLGELARSKHVDNWMSTFRHTNTYIFLANQYLASQTSSTLVRNQTDIGFFFPEKKQRSRKQIYEWFGSHFDTYDKFEDVFDRATAKPHYALVYDDEPHDPTKAYMSFKAPEHVLDVQLRFGQEEEEDNEEEDHDKHDDRRNQTQVQRGKHTGIAGSLAPEDDEEDPEEAVRRYTRQQRLSKILAASGM